MEKVRLIAKSKVAEGHVQGERGKLDTIECHRCGVDFDPAPFVPGAPCIDCQYEWPTDEFTRFDQVKEREEDRKNRHIKRLWGRRYSDNEIADALGLDRSSVRNRRIKLGLEAHTFTGDEKWRDPEAVKQKIGDRMRGQHYKQGWKKGEDGVYRNPATGKG